MSRRTKSSKAKAEPTRSFTRKLPKNQGARVHDLEKRLAEALEREKVAQEQRAAAAEILRVISSSPTDVQPVFDTIVRSAMRLLGGFSATLRQLAGDQLDLVAFSTTSESGDEALKSLSQLPLAHDPMYAQMVRDRAPCFASDTETDTRVGSRRKESARARGYRSVLMVPMLCGGSMIGAIAVTRREPGSFTDEQITLLQTFADQAVIAIENVRLFNETKEALEQQTATSEILRVISQAQTDLHPVFETIADSAMRLLRAWSASVWRYEDELIRLVAARGGLPGSGEAFMAQRRVPRHPADDSPASQTVLTRTVFHSADVETDPNWGTPFRAEAKLRGFRSIVAVPMLRGDDAAGVIAVTRTDVGDFAPAEIALLQTFADQAVIAIENVRLFKELEARNRDLMATSAILQVISSSPTNVGPVFDAIVDKAAKLGDGIFSTLISFDGELMRLEAAHNWTSEAFEHLSHGILPAPPSRALPAGRAILGRTVIHLPDIELDQEFRHPELPRAVGFRSVLSVPMLRDGVPLGAISVARAEPGPFSDNQIDLLKTFADQAVIAIENVRLFTELQQKNAALTEAHAQVTEALDQQTATAEILRTIAQAQSDAQPVFDTIVRSTARLCKSVMASVLLTDGQMLYLPANYGSSPEALAAVRGRFPRPLNTETVSGIAITTQSVVVVPDVDDPSVAEFTRQAGRLLGYRSLVAVPMLHEGGVIGALNVCRQEPGRFSEGEIALLQTFANQAVIAIENVRLFKELEARTAALTHSVEQLTALGDVGRAVSSTLDLETVLTTIVSRAVELSGLDGGVVFEYDEAIEEFVQRVATETAGALAEARRTVRIQKGEGVVGRTALTLEPVQVPDITVPGAHGGRLRDTLIESGVRAVLAIPMVYEGRLIGSLGVTRNRPGEFPAETIELLRTFATQSALAIQNARLFREIEDKGRQLEAASQHKSEFLANMSHELRTPLNAIIGFSEVLNERMFGELNEKQDEYLKDIYASGQHLLSLINDILDLSKIEAGKMELEATDFDLPSAIDNALTLVRERATRRGITLGRTIDERLGIVRGDERKIKQVLLNLLSNALKFTPEGGRIDVRAAMSDGMVEVSVADTGVGIAPEDQEAIFEEFRQVGTADKKVEGTGLGLALSRKFIELHGGRISVKSELGKGSTFAFSIPVGHGE